MREMKRRKAIMAANHTNAAKDFKITRPVVGRV